MTIIPGEITREQAFELMFSAKGHEAAEQLFGCLSSEARFWINEDGKSFYLNDPKNWTYEGDVYLV